MNKLRLQDTEGVSFKNESYALSSLAFYSNLLQNRKWTDCVLVGGDGVRVSAHMLMLAVHSPYLAQLLKLQRTSEETCLIIPSFPGWVIEDIVAVMYGRKVTDLWRPGGELVLEAAQLLGCNFIEGFQPPLEDDEQQEIVELLDKELAEQLYQDVAEHLGEVVEQCQDDGEKWDLFQEQIMIDPVQSSNVEFEYKTIPNITEEHLENTIKKGIKENGSKVMEVEPQIDEGFTSLESNIVCAAQLERSSVIVSTKQRKPLLCILEEKEKKTPTTSIPTTYLCKKDIYLQEEISNQLGTKRSATSKRRILNRRHNVKRRDIELPQLPPDSYDSAVNEETILCSEHIQPRRRRLLRLALTCKGCHKVFMSGKELEEHMKQDHAEEVATFRCILNCDVSFSTFSLLCHHSAMVHKLNLNKLIGQLGTDHGRSRDREFKCRLCGEKFMFGRGLQRHFGIDHEGELPFECGFCGHQTSEISRYNRHLVCHQVARQKEYCDICFKEFRNKVSLKTHRNMVHKLGKKYPCSYCEKVLYSSQYLKKHEATHIGKRFREVLCKYCGKSVEYSKIKNHELIHTGEKPFQCPECNYRCIQRSNLRIHMKGVHGTELPRLALGQKRYSGMFMDGTAGNTDPFDLRSIFHNKRA